MRFPIAIEPGNDTQAFGVVVPDLPGCFSAGDTLDEAIANAPEAIANAPEAILLHLESLLEEDTPLPEAHPLEEHRKNPEFDGWLWAIVDVDLNALSDKIERVNITLPHRVLRALDVFAKRHGESRSGFLARAALMAMREETKRKA
jgi:predicted RNase H-like HicB family nuclease